MTQTKLFSQHRAKEHIMIRHRLSCVTALIIALLSPLTGSEPLKIAYSDWPGWVAWDIAVQKGWFKEAGVDCQFIWFEYGPSMEAFTGDSVDAVCVTNGDALVLGATGRQSVGVVLNDYSDGNDMVVGGPKIGSFTDLKGKKVGVEVGFVDHLLLLKALEANGMKDSDIQLVNMATSELPQALASGQLDAVSAWQPHSGMALKLVAGSKTLFTSKDAPGLIYDGLYVSKDSLAAHREDWAKVVKTWFRVVDFINDPKNKDEALKIMSARVGLAPAEYEKILGGTHFLDLAGNQKHYAKGAGLESVYGSTAIVDGFNVANKIYDKAQDPAQYLDPSVVEALK
jgi:NitT/TauT family transport system substrate-binding protein